jgi:hypothetical protein
MAQRRPLGYWLKLLSAALLIHSVRSGSGSASHSPT